MLINVLHFYYDHFIVIIERSLEYGELEKSKSSIVRSRIS